MLLSENVRTGAGKQSYIPLVTMYHLWVRWRLRWTHINLYHSLAQLLPPRLGSMQFERLCRFLCCFCTLQQEATSLEVKLLHTLYKLLQVPASGGHCNFKLTWNICHCGNQHPGNVLESCNSRSTLELLELQVLDGTLALAYVLRPCCHSCSIFQRCWRKIGKGTREKTRSYSSWYSS